MPPPPEKPLVSTGPTWIEKAKEIATAVAPAAGGLGTVGSGIGGFLDAKNVEEWGRKQQEQAEFEYEKDRRRVTHQVDQLRDQVQLHRWNADSYARDEEGYRTLSGFQHRRAAALEGQYTRYAGAQGLGAREIALSDLKGQVERLDAQGKLRVAEAVVHEVGVENREALRRIEEEREQLQGRVVARSGAAGLETAGSVEAQVDELAQMGERALGLQRAKGRTRATRAAADRDVAAQFTGYTEQKIQVEARQERERVINRISELESAAGRAWFEGRRSAEQAWQSSVRRWSEAQAAIHKEKAVEDGTWSLAHRPGLPDYIGMAEREATAARIGAAATLAAGTIEIVQGLGDLGGVAKNIGCKAAELAGMTDNGVYKAVCT